MPSQYKTLADASGYDPRYGHGKTEIWYTKPGYTRDFRMGPDWLKKKGILPAADDIEITHVHVGNVDVSDLDEVWGMMQGEIWSPKGEARNLISGLELGHTSMSVGDIIKIGDRVEMVDREGFKKL
jgi:hypothetical protein